MTAITSIEGIDLSGYRDFLRCEICDREALDEVVFDTWECRQRKGHHFYEYLCPDCAPDDVQLNEEFVRISRFAKSGTLAAGVYGERIAFLSKLGLDPDWED